MATRKPTDAEPFLPAGKRSLPKLREASAHCQGCDPYLHATQTVFGESRRAAFDALIEDLRLVAERLNAEKP
jgi:hypothetical protein